MADASTAPGGDPTDRLATLTYAELKSLARRFMRGERDSHTLQTTALVHEAFIRLRRIHSIEWEDRSHFLCVAAVQMRRILVEHARSARAAKRHVGDRRVSFADGLLVTEDGTLDVLALDQALRRLADLDARQHRVAELRIFGGLSLAEIAEIVGVSERTVKRDWRVARPWLARSLVGGPDAAHGRATER